MAKPRSPQEAEEKAIEDKAEEEAIRKANEKAIKKRAKKEAIETLDSSSIVNPGTKKRTASTHEPSDHPQKPHKRLRKKRASTPVNNGAEDVGTLH
jgi:hypothetical protein